MVLKSSQFEPERAEQIEENLDELDKTLDRLKVLYEQYFLGIQKQPPSYIHTDVERKIRELTQLNIRNTGLRYRFNTLQQKFGSYNSYWRRTLRQIEHGTYTRNLSKIGRKAARNGDAIPDEILAAMPKRMRDQVLRDREAALQLAKRQKLTSPADDFVREAHTQEDLLTLAEPADEAAFISEPSILRREVKNNVRRDGAILLDEHQEFDLDAFLAANTHDDAPRSVVPAAPRPAAIVAAPPRTAPPPIPSRVTGVVPVLPATPARLRTPSMAPSQQVKPLPIKPGSTTQPVPRSVQSGGGREREPRDTQVDPPAAVRAAVGRPPGPPLGPPPGSPLGPPPGSPLGPPPGMTDRDVDALYTRYVAAKKMVGEDVVGSTARDKLLRTINAQAPRIMEQYKAKGVDFSVVVKDNQVIIRAKPKP